MKSRSTLTWISAGLVVGLLSTAGFAQSSDVAPDVLRNAHYTGALPGDFEPFHTRSRGVIVDHSRLMKAQPGDFLRFELFDDIAFIAEMDKTSDLASGNRSARATLIDDPNGWVDMVYSNTVLVANFHSDLHGLIQVRAGGMANLHAVYFVDLDNLPGCGTDHRHAVPTTDESGGGISYAGGDPIDFFDVMVVWTKKAQDAAGGIDGMNALVDLAIVETNEAYINSDINSRARLVYKSKVGYSEPNGFGGALDDLTYKNDGHMDEVHDIRDEVGADLVAILIRDNQYCGVAWLMTTLSNSFEQWAFSATNWSCATGTNTFAHELGHNQGSHHDHDNAGGALFSYSYGHRFNGQGGPQYRTVMAYSPGTRIRHFSNPDIDYDGTPTGIPEGQNEAADNARSINEAALTVANWRSTTLVVNEVLFSTRNTRTVGGLTWEDGDIIAMDRFDHSMSMVMDVSDVIPDDIDIDALVELNDGSFVISLRDPGTITGLSGGPNGGSVEDHDLIQFIPTQLGDDTAGSFEFYFDGSDVGLDTNGEDIDAVSLDANGDLILSFRSAFDVGGGVAGKDEDLVVFAPTSLGASTSGSWSFHFDGSDKDAKVGQKGEDVNALHYDASSDSYTVSTAGDFRIPNNRTGFDHDLISFLPTQLGATTEGLWMNVLEGEAVGLGSSDIVALHLR